jgi:hypothetical protein
MNRTVKAIGAVACALVSVSFLAPTALGAPELTYPTGTRLSVGSLFQMTNVGTTRFTDPSGVNLYTCEAVVLTGELVKNNGTEVEANITNAVFGTPFCTSTMGEITMSTGGAKGVPWCFRATAGMAADEFQIRGGKCSEASREISYTLSGAASCTYGRTEPLKGTFTTDTGISPTDAVLTLNSQAFARKSGIGFLCPTEYRWDLTFTLETDEAVSQPWYFS